MDDKNFKWLKWLIIFWTIAKLILSIVVVVFSYAVSEEVFDMHNSNNDWIRSAAKSDDKPRDVKEIRESFINTFNIVVLVINFIDGIFRKFLQFKEMKN
jgi:hypothetical protein